MPTILQLRRGSTAENDVYTGSVGELTVDTTLNTVRVHDGSTAGGTVVGKSTGNIQVAVTGDNEIDTSSGNLTIDSAGGTVTVDDNLTVSGNLTVNGTTTTVNSTNTTLDDNLLELNSGASTNANDSGIIIERGSTGDNAIIAWDESADKFVVGTTTATASDTGNLSISTGTLVANIEATTATLGGSNVVSTDNSLTLTNKTISGSSNTISNIANSSLTNCSITINGSSVALGGSTTITAGCDWSVNCATSNITVQDDPNTNINGFSNTMVGASAGKCTGTASSNTFIGSSAGYFNTSGDSNTAIGRSAGAELTQGYCNVLLGTFAGAGCGQVTLSTGSNNILIGHYSAPSSSTANNEITIGNVTHNLLRIPGLGSTDGQVLTYSSASGGIVLAAAAGCDWSVNCNNSNITVQDNPNTNIAGSNNILVGSYAGKSGTITGNSNVLMGYSAGYCASTGGCNVSIGDNAGDGISTGSCNVSIGGRANYSCNGGTTIGNNNIVFGHYAAPSSSTANNEITIGNVTHNLLRIPGLGSTDGQVLTYSSSCGGIVLAAASGGGGCDYTPTCSASNIVISETQNTTMTGNNNTVVGNIAGGCITSAGQSTFVGSRAGCSVTNGSSNVGVGYESIKSVVYGGNNTAIGVSAMSQSGAGVNHNTVVGASAGYFNESCNISIGTYAGTGSGSMGIYPGITGTNNIVIGYDAQPSSGNVSNEITLGNATHNLLRIPGLGSTDGQVLTYSSASGGIVLAAAGGCDWSVNCNNSNITVQDNPNTNIAGSNNILVGSYAGKSGTITGNSNVLMGYSAGYCASTGACNVSIGDNAGDGISTGSCNVSIGGRANYSCAGGTLGGGSNNVVIGYYALPSNATASNEITLGNATHTLLRIPGLGSTDGQVLTYSSSCGGIVLAAASGGGGGCDYTPTSSTTNIVISETQNTTMTGSYNTTIGDNAGMCLTGGNYNTLVGGYAGMFSTSANSNTFVGSGAGRDTTTGSKNTSIGRSAGIGITTGNCNISIGDSANYKLGSYGIGTTTGNNNVVIGWYAQPSSEGASNEITIGNVTHNLLRIPGLGSTDGQVLTYSSSCGGIVLAAAGGCDWSVNSSNSNITVQDNPNTCINGFYNILIGSYAGKNGTITADNNILIGGSAGYFTSTGACNISIGSNAGDGISSGSCNVSIGTRANWSCNGGTTIGNNNIVFGHYAAPSSSTANNEITIGNVTHTIVRTNGSIVPFTSNTQDLGAMGNVWANIYTGDLNLSNEDGTGNSIDGTTGNWTIQEGANDLFLINNKSGKKYKFNIEEV